jgi:pimeloyl-ACP methyl ester carboxylesterase
VRLLGRTYHIVTLDLPGFGLTRAPAGTRLDYESDVAFVEAFAQARHLDRFVIGGSSMGGGVAWRYALAHTARVKGLILADAAGWPEPPVFDKTSFPGNALANPLGRAVLIDLDNKSTLGDGLRGAFADPNKADPAYVAKYADLSRAPARRRQWLDILFGWEKQRFATPQALATLKVPTLILWGAQDQLIPLDSARRFVAAIPGAHLIVYPKVGHLPAEEAPDASAADVGAFLHMVDPPKKAAAGGPPKPPTPVKKPEKNLLVFY